MICYGNKVIFNTAGLEGKMIYKPPIVVVEDWMSALTTLIGAGIAGGTADSEHLLYAAAGGVIGYLVSSLLEKFTTFPNSINGELSGEKAKYIADRIYLVNRTESYFNRSNPNKLKQFVSK